MADLQPNMEPTEGVITYPSGNTAVVACKQAAGYVVTFMSDSKNSQILASFDSKGVGGVNYPNGRPWLVVTESGYTLSDKKGNVVERIKFPRTSQEVITLEPTECISVRFTNRQSIVAVFSRPECRHEWQCGEALRRTEAPYTAKVVGTKEGGRLELDVAAIRQRQQAVGSVYVPPGPHRTETERPGIGSLKKALRNLDPASDLSATVSELRNLDTRLGYIETLPRVLYGTARSASAGTLARGTIGSSGGGSGGNLGATTASLVMGSSGRMVLEDYGSPELSKTQRRFASSLRGLDPEKVRHKARRAKLPWMRLRDLDSAVWGATAPGDTLQVLCVLADWNPVCAKVEAVLEAAHGALVEEAAARSGCEAARVKMWKVDASEGNLLQDRYGFKTVPMLLMFYEGKLVAATNNVRTEAQARDAALGALMRGRKREVLPEGWRFGTGADNSLLDYLKPSTVLREL
ncbi:hypothetical protein HYH02_004985 [Chlamydomonas schloesseri]|uniref:FAM194 C-terminal domain-containing protein n=1 Tax=Chlamydomonas schloesseri TaxID=2026947 RepID=A0A835WNH6_9CHLO|nr:hypothetical protein HYH02_004985 [Chlamydomonas schloesseri]|eukprot:KAG2450484.1 hypothetical protein HYH02_004985 [Chlamydomonas schloesseri]